MNDDSGDMEAWAFCAEGEEPRYRLVDALDRRDLAEVRRLIGLHPEFLDGFTDNEGVWEVTPIAHAAFDGQAEIVRWLLASGAKPDTVASTGRTALEEVTLQAYRSGDLYESGRAGYFRVIRLLVDAGADPCTERDGTSPDASFRQVHGIGLLDALAEFERRHGPG